MYKRQIFDSVYDSDRGVIIYVRVFEGTLNVGDRIKMMATGAEFDVVETGYLRPLGFEPVSYTHLDVYKRQLLRCALM